MAQTARSISTSAIQVQPVGFGAMGLAAFYGKPADQETVNALLDECVNHGYTMIDTADAYSPMSYGQLGFGESQIGNYLKSHPTSRDKLFIATKFGFTVTPDGFVLRGDHDYVHSACAASLKRLGVEQIDLYYAHRPNLNCDIKDTIHAMKELKEQGKIRFIGVSEYNVEQLEEANHIVKIDALQIELSLWTPQILKNGILEWCEKNNTTVVAYRPLGIGFLSGAFQSADTLESDDIRRMHPRFSEANAKQNSKLVALIDEIAKEKSLSKSQICLAWVLAKSASTLALPGTKKISNLKDNFGAGAVRLDEKDVQRLDEIVNSFEVGGPREGDVPWKSTAF